MAVPALLLGVPVPGCLHAQGPFQLGVGTTLTTRPKAGVVAGPAAVWWAGSQDRIVASLGIGGRGEGLLARLDLLWEVRVPAGSSPRVAPVVHGGVAVETDGVWREWLVLGAGVEVRDGAGRQWLVQAGWGGGVRLAAGIRWRLSGQVPR